MPGRGAVNTWLRHNELMRLARTSVAIGAVAAVFAAAAGADPKPAHVTQSAIGGLTLRLTASEYASTLHEKPFETPYPDGSRRLLFSRAEVTVFLGKSGRGERITTAAPEYTLGRGLGPCGGLRALSRALRLTPVAIRGAFGASAVVYRAGHLWFTLSDPKHIGSVTLSAAKPNLQRLIGAAQCGVGEENGE